MNSYSRNSSRRRDYNAPGSYTTDRFYLVEITDKKTSYPPYFIDLMHTRLLKYAHLSNRIEGIGQTVAEAYGISRSPLIMEFVIDKDGEPFLIEAVPEFGGEFLPDVLIPASAAVQHTPGGDQVRDHAGFQASPGPEKQKCRCRPVCDRPEGSARLLQSRRTRPVEGHDFFPSTQGYRLLHQRSGQQPRPGRSRRRDRTHGRRSDRTIRAERRQIST